MRCSRCGNDNPDSNRFCGMCGATMLEVAPAPSPTEKPVTTPAAAAPAAAVGSGASRQEPASARSASLNPQGSNEAAPSVEEIRGITGPSFLGLNDPPARGRRTNLSIDSNQRGSRNLDYLLDDDEAPKGSGAGKVFLILIVLALAGGYGYLRWKNQVPPWLGLGQAKPAATAQNAPDGSAPTETTPDAGSAQPAPGNSSPANGGAPANVAPGNAAGSTTANQPSTNQSSPGQSSAGQSSASQPSANQPTSAPPASAQPPAAQPAASSASNAPTDGSAGDDGSAARQPAAGKDKADADSENSDSEKAGSANSGSDSSSARTSGREGVKPPAAIAPPKADPVSEAQKYLYGQHVQQDCARGMRILKPSADSGNPKAMIEMGALYSAGLCAPRDLPTSYRWFALALRKDPNNTSLQSDLQKLWGEMTQPERQLAIRLSQ